MTEPKRHPWADVLIAIAEGREVQFRSVGGGCYWTDFRADYHAWPGVSSEILNPIGNPHLEWRVKPQKLKRWVNVYKVDNSVVMWETKEEADKAGAGDCRRIACIEIEFEEGDGL